MTQGNTGMMRPGHQTLTPIMARGGVCANKLVLVSRDLIVSIVWRIPLAILRVCFFWTQQWPILVCWLSECFPGVVASALCFCEEARFWFWSPGRPNRTPWVMWCDLVKSHVREIPSGSHKKLLQNFWVWNYCIQYVYSSFIHTVHTCILYFCCEYKEIMLQNKF